MIDTIKAPEAINDEVPIASPIIRWFDYGHLPEELQQVSEPFYHLAWGIEKSMAHSAEKSTCLRKLLEAKDCAVRASMV